MRKKIQTYFNKLSATRGKGGGWGWSSYGQYMKLICLFFTMAALSLDPKVVSLIFNSKDKSFKSFFKTILLILFAVYHPLP